MKKTCIVFILALLSLSILVQGEDKAAPVVTLHNLTPTIKVGEYMIVKVGVTPAEDPVTIYVKYGDQPYEVMGGTIIIKEATQPGLISIAIRVKNSKGTYSEVQTTKINVLKPPYQAFHQAFNH